MIISKSGNKSDSINGKFKGTKAANMNITFFKK